MTEVSRLRLDLAPCPHDYVVGDGVLRQIGELAHSVPGLRRDGPVLVVTDAGVATTSLVGRVDRSLTAAGYQSTVVVVPQGEAAKTIASLERLWNMMAGAGLERGSPLFALGGGAVGDVTGFAAASWMRGTPVVQLPTTLLAMADSAVGGKTGVNLAAGKNLVGAIHMPSLIVADLRALDSLPDRQIRSGLAEIVKCAILSDRPKLALLSVQAEQFLARDRQALSRAISLAVRVKIDHVRDDAHEHTGRRALLNLGHTAAHALETVSGLGEIPHGEAVAVGLLVAAEIAARRQLCEPTLVGVIEGALAALGLPTRLPHGANAAELVEASRMDKKRRDGARMMALPTAVTGATLLEVDDAEFLSGLRARA